jgi:hypothetical protein
MYPSREIRDKFLDGIRDGLDRSQAAQQVGLTGSVFRRLCGKEPEFLAEYEQAFADGAETRRQRKDGRANGRSRLWEPADEVKEEFLDLVRSGHTRSEAAAKVGTTGVRWQNYMRHDPEFRLLFEEALKEGEPEFQERLRSEYRRRAIDGGSDRLISNLGLAHLPELKPLLTKRMEIANAEGEALRILAGQAMQLTDDELKALDERLKSMSAAELKELEQGGEVIELRQAE